MKNILVTGGLGFIGSNFIKHIFDKYDYKIFNLDAKTYAIDNSKIQNELNWLPSVNFKDGLKELI